MAGRPGDRDGVDVDVSVIAWPGSGSAGEKVKAALRPGLLHRGSTCDHRDAVVVVGQAQRHRLRARGGEGVGGGASRGVRGEVLRRPRVVEVPLERLDAVVGVGRRLRRRRGERVEGDGLVDGGRLGVDGEGGEGRPVDPERVLDEDLAALPVGDSQSHGERRRIRDARVGARRRRGVGLRSWRPRRTLRCRRGPSGR